MKDNDFENINRIIDCWKTLQSSSDNWLTRKIVGESFKENLSTLDLDTISRNLIDEIFTMDYDELVEHINNLGLDEEDKIQIFAVLKEV